MSFVRAAVVVLLAMMVSGCPVTINGGGTSGGGSSGTKEPPSKGFPMPGVQDSVYSTVDRQTGPPKGYGLYTVLLTRSPSANTVRVLADLFRTTSSAKDAAIAHENLNLITIPVKNVAEADSALADARNHADEAATLIVQKHYDYGQAALLMSSVCRPERGTAVMKACGSSAPDGPFLVTTQIPLNGAVAPNQRLLIVNLSTTSAQAIPEIMAAYRRQILRKDYTDNKELDSWRLWVLDHVLEVAAILPEIRKAYSGS